MIITGMKITRQAIVSNNFQQIRHCQNPLCTPPRIRISFAEKFAHGAVMFVGILAIPVYILLNLKKYQGSSPQ